MRKRLTQSQDYQIVFKKILKFFKGHRAKATDWMLCENVNLGGLSPVQMLEVGRGKKLLKWVVSAINENQK